MLLRLYITFTITITQVDLDRPLEEQGPFDLIIQKLTEYMAAAIKGSKEAMKTLKGVEVVISPIECVCSCDQKPYLQKMKQKEKFEYKESSIPKRIFDPFNMAAVSFLYSIPTSPS